MNISTYFKQALVCGIGVLMSTHEVLAQTHIANPAIIAHRGDSFHAPESTIPAYLLACKMGADYLELDLQRTKDGQLIALHDNNLKRTTNVEDVYPQRAAEPVSAFTLEELQALDAGSWYNQSYPERARPSYKGLKIVTLDQVSEIAKACPSQPGLYIETKVPKLFPGIERDLKQYLQSEGWLEADKAGQVILQTFEKPSLVELQKVMPTIPKFSCCGPVMATLMRSQWQRKQTMNLMPIIMLVSKWPRRKLLKSGSILLSKMVRQG
ncbi:glycerophosphodiester phosphodiesterase family protein [Vibrio olivae]